MPRYDTSPALPGRHSHGFFVSEVKENKLRKNGFSQRTGHCPRQAKNPNLFGIGFFIKHDIFGSIQKDQDLL